MGNNEPVYWRGFRAIEKLILLLLPLAAVLALAVPYLDQVFLRRLSRLPGARSFVTWLVNGNSSWVLGLGLLLAFVLFALLVRYRLVRDKRLWFSSGCPECKERELVRVTRNKFDRPYGLLAIPAYRYACRNCTWRGLRIGRREYSPERLAELEASLLRFDPDSIPAPLPAEPAEVELADVVADTHIEDVDEVEGIEAAAVYEFAIEELEESAGEIEEELTDDEEPPQETDNNETPEPVEDIEWLWRRSADS